MQVPRMLLKNVRSVLRRLWPDRNARLGPTWVVLRAGPQGLVIQAQDTEVALSVRLDNPRPSEVLLLPTTALAELEGRAGDVVLEASGTAKIQARWTDGAVPRVVEFDTTDLAKLPKFPDVPTSLVLNPPGFLAVFDEAMRTTANDNVRYVLAKNPGPGRCQSARRERRSASPDPGRLQVRLRAGCADEARRALVSPGTAEPGGPDQDEDRGPRRRASRPVGRGSSRVQPSHRRRARHRVA